MRIAFTSLPTNSKNCYFLLQVKFTFIAKDEFNASVSSIPTIKMCACENGGQCVAPELGDTLNNDFKFIVQGCICGLGYTGRFCENDLDACTFNGNPCFTGVNCTDKPPPYHISGFTCEPCPSGYSGDGIGCTGKSPMILECDWRPFHLSAAMRTCSWFLKVYRTFMWVISVNGKKPGVFLACFIMHNKTFYLNCHLLAISTSVPSCSKTDKVKR